MPNVTEFFQGLDGKMTFEMSDGSVQVKDPLNIPSSSGAALPVGTLPQGMHAPDVGLMTPKRTDIDGITLTWGPSNNTSATALAEYAALGTPYVDFTTQAQTDANGRYVQLRHSTGLRWNSHSALIDSGINRSGGNLDTSQGGAGIEIVVQGNSVAFGFISNAVGKARIKVNGDYLRDASTYGWVTDPANITPASSAPQFVRINFPYFGRWRVFFQGPRIKGIFVDSNQYIAPAEPMPLGLGFGDSFASRQGSTGDAEEFGQMNQLAGICMGVDMLALGKGGTGFGNSGSQYNYVEGINWLAANRPLVDPSYVWGFGTGNDSTNLPILQARCEEFIESALTNYGSRSLRNVIITSAYNAFNTVSVADSVNVQLKAAIAAINDPRVVYVPVDATDGDSTPIFTGTGSVANRTGDGNADFYLSTPTQGAGDRHPNRAGVLHAAESYAWQIWQALAYGRRDWK